MKAQMIVVLSGQQRFAVAKSTLSQSKIVAELIEDCDDDGTAITLSLVDFEAETMRMVMEYLDRHENDDEPSTIQRPLRGPLDTVVDDWDASYAATLVGHGTRHQRLFDVMRAALFLVLPDLRDLCCAAAADMVRDKTEGEILDVFGVSEPFSKQAEEALCEEFPWLRDP
jgi:hypothetical protein